MKKIVEVDQEQYDTLLKSIEKWQRIVDGTGSDKGVRNCPLCEKYIRSFGSNHPADCIACPVYLDTGKLTCFDTPYYSWMEAGLTMVYSIKGAYAKTIVQKAMAQCELDYLKDLSERCAVAA